MSSRLAPSSVSTWPRRERVRVMGVPRKPGAVLYLRVFRRPPAILENAGSPPGHPIRDVIANQALAWWWANDGASRQRQEQQRGEQQWRDSTNASPATRRRSTAWPTA